MDIVLATARKKAVTPRYAKRLNDACERAQDCPPLHKGRLKWLQEKLAANDITVTIESVRKWLAGEARPREDRSDALAAILDVDPTLLFVGKRENTRRPSTIACDSTAPALPIAIRDGMVVTFWGLGVVVWVGVASRISKIILAHATAA